MRLLLFILVSLIAITSTFPELQMISNTDGEILNRLLKKVTLKFIQTLIVIMLMIISIALGMGLI